MGKSNFRRVSAVVTAQTAGNLEKLRKMAGYGNVGMVIDKLVRDKMVQLRMWEVRQSVCRGDKTGADAKCPGAPKSARGHFAKSNGLSTRPQAELEHDRREVRQSVCAKGSLPPSPQGGDTSLIRGRREGPGGKGGRHG